MDNPKLAVIKNHPARPQNVIPFDQREKLDELLARINLISGTLGAIHKVLDEAADLDSDVLYAQCTLKVAKTEVDNIVEAMEQLLER